jgi:serine/threonine protein kinase/tetratricopeptide (TPR) repeat protein
VDTSVRERLQGLVGDLQRAWKQGGVVDVGRYAPPPDDPLRAAFLQELVRNDIELRWQRGQRTRLDAYLRQFPELGANEGVSAELIYEEYYARHKYGDKPPLDEYYQRFPNQFAELQRLVAESPVADSPPPTLIQPSRPPDPAPVEPTPSSAKLMPQVSGYKLFKRLGSGGFGEVWRGEAPGGVEVAIKVLVSSATQAEAQRELDALERMRTLRHPYLIQLHRFWKHEDQLYIVMELADGSLRDRLKECKAAHLDGIPTEELLQYMAESAEALDYLHSKRVQHRDVKPDNILLLVRHVKLADFGLASVMESSRRLMTATGCGTPAYMAPEIWRRKVSEHSDQYSLAATYAELRLRRPLFAMRKMVDLMMAHLERQPDLSPLGAGEQEVLLKALNKDPDKRFRSCTEFVQALEQAINPTSKLGQPRPPAPAPAPVAASKPVMRLDEPPAPVTVSRKELPRPEPSTAPFQPVAASPPVELPPGPLSVLRNQVPPPSPAREPPPPPVAPPTPATPAVAAPILAPLMSPPAAPALPPMPAPPAPLEMTPRPRQSPMTVDGSILAAPRADGIAAMAPPASRPHSTGDMGLSWRAPRPKARRWLGVLAALTVMVGLSAAAGAGLWSLWNALPRSPEPTPAPPSQVRLPSPVAPMPSYPPTNPTPPRPIDPDPGAKPSAVARADELIQQGKLDEAIQVYSSALRLDKNNGLLYFQRGKAFAAQGKYEDAVRDYDQALALNPDLTKVYVHRGKAQFRLGNYPEAFRTFNRAVNLNESDPEVYFERGAALFAQKRYKDAMGDLSRCLELDPKNAEAHNLCGQAYFYEGNYKLAEISYTKALEYNPKLDRAYNARGALYLQLAVYDREPQPLLKRALEDLNKAIDLNPKLLIAHFNRGHANLNLRYYAAAVGDFSAEISLTPNDAPSYSSRALAHLRQNHIDQAIADCDKAIEIDRNEAYAYLYRAEAYEKKGDKEKAAKDYASAERLDPSLKRPQK